MCSQLRVTWLIVKYAYLIFIFISIWRASVKESCMSCVSHDDHFNPNHSLSKDGIDALSMTVKCKNQLLSLPKNFNPHPTRSVLVQRDMEFLIKSVSYSLPQPLRGLCPRTSGIFRFFWPKQEGKAEPGSLRLPSSCFVP